MSKPLTAALVALALAIPALPVAAKPNPQEQCRPFATGLDVEAAVGLRLMRLCARLVEADGSRDLTPVERDAARRLGDYLAVLATLELRAAPDGQGYRVRVVRRITETARYLIARRLGLIALADRLAPSA